MPNHLKLYESIINQALSDELDQIIETKAVHKNALEAPTSGAFLAYYLQTVIEKGLRHFKSDHEDLKKQIEIANLLIGQLKMLVEDETIDQYMISEDQILRGITDKLVKKERFLEQIPQSSVAISSLFTGGQHEPSVSSELNREIASADRVDLLVSFIKHSGLRLIYDALAEHTKTKPLRIITTSYMGASDYKAIEMLAKLPNTEVKISYDTNRTRLHAKAYYFHRDTGFSTAYIGSSNLSKAALSEGTEWNLKISEYSSLEIIQKYRVTFETYWNLGEFQFFDPTKEIDKDRLKFALVSEGNSGNQYGNTYYFDLKPYAYQQEILDRLEIEREVFGSHKNLIVAATGTGKTIVSAFDFKRFLDDHKDAKFLFLAHREEILKQSLSAYRGVLKDANFGELWVGSSVPNDYKHVFASIQTLNSNRQYTNFAKDHFDYIVLDETHHSPADSYQRIVTHFTPRILLGLTATPERLGGENILADFNDRIAYEIRLREAIERNLLCPFHYFGVSDETDLSHIKWERGRYETLSLNKLFIYNRVRDNTILGAIHKYLADIETIKGLGFCVSKEHARYMSEIFNERGIPSINLDSDSTADIRRTAQSRLLSGEIKFIFVVDLYNEGVDIPEINTVLFLRPTESPTIFIQQLGRGLRLNKDKEVLTVLDFIGQAHRQYDFRMKYQALIGRTHHSMLKEVEYDFPTLPKNCSIQFERVAKETVLKNIESSYCNLRRLRQMLNVFEASSTLDLNLRNFLSFNSISPQDLYKAITLYELKAEHHIKSNDQEQKPPKSLKNAFMKLAKVDAYNMLNFLSKWMEAPTSQLTEKESRMLLMFYFTLFSKPLEEGLVEVINQLSADVKNEVKELIAYNLSQITHLPKSIEIDQAIPLELHASYSTDQILTAFGEHTESYRYSLQGGVFYSKQYKIDLFLITLNKSEKHYKTSTMYEDYAINEWLFHWQSQSRTTVESPTGQRYVNMRENGTKVILFVREEKKDEYSATEVYTCLGLADYVNHQGSAPISITYKLHEKMPMKVLRRSNLHVDIV